MRIEISSFLFRKRNEIFYYTLTKDLTFLEEKDFLFRTHGGATLRESNIDVPIHVRSQKNRGIKKS